MTLDGNWVAIGAELGGQHIDDDFLSVITLNISADKCEMHLGGNTDIGTIKFIPHVVPMSFEITVTDGPNKGKTFKAIYKLMGGFLVVCFNTTSPDRPKSFVSNPENQYSIVRYKRSEA